MFAGKKVMSQTELELALKDLNKGQINPGMKTIMILEKRNDQSDIFFEMFMDRQEILLAELRRKIAKTSLYRLFSYRIDEIDAILKSIHPALFFIKRNYKKLNSKILITFQRNPILKMGQSSNFFFMVFETKNEQDEHGPIGSGIETRAGSF